MVPGGAAEEREPWQEDWGGTGGEGQGRPPRAGEAEAGPPRWTEARHARLPYLFTGGTCSS